MPHSLLMMLSLMHRKHEQIPERYSAKTHQLWQNVKLKPWKKMKRWFLLLTFSHQNSQSHYIYCSLCSSFFLKRSFDWRLLGSHYNLIYLPSLSSFYFVSLLLLLYKGRKISLFFCFFCIILFGKSWRAFYVVLYFSKFYHFQEESHIFKRIKSRRAWLQLFVFQMKMEKSLKMAEYSHSFMQ